MSDSKRHVSIKNPPGGPKKGPKMGVFRETCVPTFFLSNPPCEGIFLSSNLARAGGSHLHFQRRLHNASKRAGAKAKHDHLRGRYGFEKGCVGLLKTGLSVF